MIQIHISLSFPWLATELNISFLKHTTNEAIIDKIKDLICYKLLWIAEIQSDLNWFWKGHGEWCDVCWTFRWYSQIINLNEQIEIIRLDFWFAFVIKLKLKLEANRNGKHSNWLKWQILRSMLHIESHGR